MRILFLTHRLPYAPNRGDRIRAFHLLEAMSRFAKVSLFSLLNDDDVANVERVPFADEVVGVRVRPVRNFMNGALRLGTDRPLTHSLLSAPSACARLSTLVRSSAPDLVVAYCSSMARFAMAPPLDAIPFVLDMVDVDSRKWVEQASRARGVRKLIYGREARTLRAFEASAVTRARTTLVVNERERAVLADVAPQGSIRVVPNGINVSAFAPPDPPIASPTVVFCGVMNYAPNEEGVLWFADRVWPRVIAARPDARFVVVGSRPTAAVRRLMERYPSIQVTGSVPTRRGPLWRAAISVAPLHVARGLQNKVLEALAAGLPVVATSAVFEGLPNAARPGCVVGDDEMAFGAEVLRLLGLAPAERRAIAHSAKLETLGWPSALQDLPQILTDAERRPSMSSRI